VEKKIYPHPISRERFNSPTKELIEAGMDVITEFTRLFDHAPRFTVRAPGRVNLLGEHVDYNDGVVLPAAIDRAVRLAAAPTTDGIVHLHALDLRRQTAFRLDTLGQRIDIDGKPLPHWAAYPAGVAWVLAEAGLRVPGMQVVYTSDVPIGAGLSSSAAVEVAFAATWRALGGWEMDNLQLARLCQRAENAYVGVNSGLMDQFTSACGVEGHALYFDTRSLEWHPVALPPGTAIVVADSGMRRSLATSAYNERRAACEKAVALLQQYKPGLSSLRDISTVEFAAYCEYLPEDIRRRAEHVVKEIYRVQQAVNALRGGDARLFGGLMFAGHKSLRDLYQVSLPELDALVEIARGLPGIYGARLTGAGFGGCTVNLIDGAQAEAFIQALEDGYRKQTGKEAVVYLCHASAGVSAEAYPA
jgi:galactokinase